MDSCRWHSAAWAIIAAPWSLASCLGCFNRPPTSSWTASSPRWRCSPCSSLSFWHAPKVSPAGPPNVAYDGHVNCPVAIDSRRHLWLGERDRRRTPFRSAVYCRRDSALVRRWLLGADRDPRVRLLGAGRGPQFGRRLCRPDCDWLGGAAHPRRLHHERARG